MVRRFALVAALLALPIVDAGAQTATQTVAFDVESVNALSTSGNPGTLTLNSATAGSGITAATDATTTYSLTTNAATWKITAILDANMPADLQLTVAMEAPGASATSSATILSATGADVVTGGTGSLNASGKTITYTLSAPTGIAAQQTDSRVVTFTLVPLT